MTLNGFNEAEARMSAPAKEKAPRKPRVLVNKGYGVTTYIPYRYAQAFRDAGYKDEDMKTLIEDQVVASVLKIRADLGITALATLPRGR